MGNPSGMNRRKFMEIGIYTISATIAAVSGAALARFAVGRSFDKERPKWVKVELGDNSAGGGRFQRVVLEYETKVGWMSKTARTLAYVQQTKKDEVIAISAGCTHLGCIVTWDDQEEIFKCPCHNGRYDTAGNVISGPPPAALRRHPTKVENGKIFLRTETVSYGGHNREGV